MKRVIGFKHGWYGVVEGVSDEVVVVLMFFPDPLPPSPFFSAFFLLYLVLEDKFQARFNAKFLNGKNVCIHFSL